MEFVNDDFRKAVASAFIDMCIVICAPGGAGVGSVMETWRTGTKFMRVDSGSVRSRCESCGHR